MSSSSTNTKEIRRFGIIAFLFFGGLFALALWRQRTMITYLFGAFSLLGLSFITAPTPLKGIHDGWLRIARFIGEMITLIALTLAYYVVMTPSALLKRVFGGRPLPTLPDKDVSSYWVSRTEPAQPKERFSKRY